MSSFLSEYDELKNHTQYHLKSVHFFKQSFDMLPKEKLYQLKLSFALSLQISVLFAYK